MRMMSSKSPVTGTVLAVVLALGVVACSDKDEQSQQADAQSSQQVVQPHTAPAEAAPTPVAEEPVGNVFVPAPISPEAQNDPGRRRYTYEVTNEYKCKNGTAFKVVFQRNPSVAAITFPGRVTVTLPRQELQGAGFWYADAQYSLRGSGPIAQWAMKGRQPVDCEVKVYEAP